MFTIISTKRVSALIQLKKNLITSNLLFNFFFNMNQITYLLIFYHYSHDNHL